MIQRLYSNTTVIGIELGIFVKFVFHIHKLVSYFLSSKTTLVALRE
jgi:hypothetical protein